MARFNFLASVPETQLAELRQDETALLQPSLVLGASHFLGDGAAANSLRETVHRAMNGGHLVSDRLWHPIRGPRYHNPEEVRALTAELRRLASDVPRYAPDDCRWTTIEFARVVQLFEHAAAAGECVVSMLESMDSSPAECKVRRLWKRPWDGSLNPPPVSRWRTFRQSGVSFPEALVIVCSAAARLAMGERMFQLLQRLMNRFFEPQRRPQVAPRETEALRAAEIDRSKSDGGIDGIFYSLVDTNDAKWIYLTPERVQRVARRILQEYPSHRKAVKSPDGNLQTEARLSSILQQVDASTWTSALGIVSFYHDGYVRQEAVRQLAQIHDGNELPYLLIRQNDWVAEICRDATAAVHERLTQDYLAHFVACLPLLTRLARVRRRDLSETVHRFVELLVEPQNDVLLAQAASFPDRRARRQIVRLAFAKEGGHVRRMVARGFNANDPAIRLWCLRKARECLDDLALREALETLRRDPFMAVRREALMLAAELFPDWADKLWRQTLLDSSFSLRELAQLRVTRSGQDTAAFYRDALAVQRSSWVALSGLGETGESSDLAVIRGYLEAPLPCLRRAAIRGLAKIGGESTVAELVERLRDEAPSVVQTVRKQLLPHTARIEGRQLYGIVIEDPREHVRLVALRLLCELGKWTSLPWLVRAAGHNDPATAAEAQRLIERWFSPALCHRNFTVPSSEQRQAIWEAANDPNLPAMLCARVVQWMDRV